MGNLPEIVGSKTTEWNLPNKAEIIQVIKTNLEVHGNGKDIPYQRMTQYWSFDGQLLWEE